MRGNERFRIVLSNEYGGPERPIIFRGNCIELTNQKKKAAQLILPLLRVPCAYTMIHRYSEAGFSVRDICNIFNHIPAELASVLEEGLRAMQRNAPLVLPVAGEKRMPGSENAMQFHEKRLLDNIKDFGCVRLEWNKEGERESVYFNDVFALLAGAHKEELLSRAASCELPLPMTELDLICTILDDVLRCGSSTITRYVRWRVGFVNGGQGQAAFLKWTRNKSISPAQGIENALHSFSFVTPEEYDWAMHTTPELCRPLMWELGDFRSASSCLNDIGKDWHDMRISDLQSSDHGRHLLSRLTELVRLKFAPFVRAANMVQMEQSEGHRHVPACPQTVGAAQLCEMPLAVPHPTAVMIQGWMQASAICQGERDLQFVSPHPCGPAASQLGCGPAASQLGCASQAMETNALSAGILPCILQNPHDAEKFVSDMSANVRQNVSDMSANVRQNDLNSFDSINHKWPIKNDKEEHTSQRDVSHYTVSSEANMALNHSVAFSVLKSTELRLERFSQDLQCEFGQFGGLEDPLEAILPRLD